MKTRENILNLKNKEFIFTCLDMLKSKCRADYLSVLTNPDESKRRFDMNFSILQEVSSIGSISKEHFMDTSGHRRYYPDTFSDAGRRFIVCNDWYYNTKSNKRDTRTEFVNWVFRSIQ